MPPPQSCPASLHPSSTHARTNACTLFNRSPALAECHVVSIPSFSMLTCATATCRAPDIATLIDRPNWVANGMLQQRTEGQTYSPNYPPAPPAPPAPPPKAGDVITFESVKGGASCLPSTPQCFKQVGAAIQVIGQQPGQPWCVTLDSAGTGLVVELCDPASSLQQFALLGKGDARTITTSNGAKCVGADSTARSRVVVADCPTSPSAKKADIFIFGASGRLCNSDDGCLTVDIASGRSDGGTTGTGTGTDTIAWPDAPTRARLGLPSKISHLN